MKISVKTSKTTQLHIYFIIKLIAGLLFDSYCFFPVCIVQWKREQEFDLQLLERAVQGEEAQAVRSVQGAERPPEHKERPRSHSDEWLTFRSMVTTPTHEVDLEPLEYDVDLNKEVSCIDDTELKLKLKKTMKLSSVCELFLLFLNAEMTLNSSKTFS